MKRFVFSIRDAKAQAFTYTLTAVTHGLAERQFGDFLRQPDSTQQKYPGDFSLWLIGVFDDETGVIEGCSPSEIVSGPVSLQIVKEA